MADRGAAHAGEALHARAAREAHQQGLGLVVEMMRGEERRARVARPFAEQAVAHRARALLDRRLGLFVPVGGEDDVRDAEPRADLRDHLGFGAAFRAERVVDGCRFDLAGPRLGGEEQQGEAVRTARDRDAEARVCSGERSRGRGGIGRGVSRCVIASGAKQSSWIAASLRSPQ